VGFLASNLADTMNIVVCVKHVPDATGDRHFEADFTVDRVGVDGLLSELDEYAVEQALRITEKREGEEHTVTALCVGPEKALDAVRKALQMGCDAGVHVVDDAIAGSDAIATSLVLAKAVEKIRRDAGDEAGGGGVDLVVCGMASTDGSMSVVPAMLAERLGLPQVTFASVIETQGDQVRIKRDSDSATEVIGATMPLVLSVTDQSGEARYPSFKGIMAAKKKPMETWSLADIGVEAEEVGLSVAWSHVAETTARPPRTAGDVVKDEGGSGAVALADFLAAKKFI
jgi:electron transfer flavoprotein beta subunit